MVQYYYLGKGSISNLKDLLNKKRESENQAFVVVVIDHFFKDKSILDLSYLTSEDVIIYADTTHEPKTSYVDELVNFVKQKNSNAISQTANELGIKLGGIRGSPISGKNNQELRSSHSNKA